MDEDELDEDEETEQDEWTRYQIMLPEDDYDEDDELDQRLEETKRRNKNRVARGNFFGTM